MTLRDRGAFAELMLAMGEVYGEPVSDARLEIYYAALQDMAIEAIRHAATVHVQTNKWFPKPAELREAITGSIEDEAEMAWLEVLKQIRRVGWCGVPQWTNDAARRAAMELFGGWRALCETLPEPGTPAFLGAAKNFKAVYAAQARRERSGELGPGRDEAKRLLENVKLELVKRGLPTGQL